MLMNLRSNLHVISGRLHTKAIRISHPLLFPWLEPRSTPHQQHQVVPHRPGRPRRLGNLRSAALLSQVVPIIQAHLVSLRLGILRQGGALLSQVVPPILTASLASLRLGILRQGSALLHQLHWLGVMIQCISLDRLFGPIVRFSVVRNVA